jgi:hypothetical protein
MKKIRVVLISLVLVSCATTTTKRPEKTALFEVVSQQSDGGANIHFFEIISEPNEFRMLQNDKKLRNKIGSSDIQKSNFVVLNMGEKPTGGFSIAVDTVVETDKNIIISVKEKSPDKQAMVSQAFTYPFCVVKINSKKEIIIK